MLMFKFCIFLILVGEIVFAYNNEAIGVKHIFPLHGRNKRPRYPRKTTIKTTIRTTSERVSDVTTEAPTSTTTEDVTTDENSTPGPTTERGPHPHPTCHFSLFTVSDLKVIIDSIKKDMQVTMKIKENFTTDAVALQSKYLHELKTFRQKFQDRPLDLLPILNGMRTLREQILKPLVEAAHIDSNEIPSLENQFTVKQEEYKKLLTELHRHEQICKYACKTEPIIENRYGGRDEIFGRFPGFKSTKFTLSMPNNSYCASYEDVRNIINRELEIFSENAKNMFREKLNQDDIKYQKEIDEIMNSLKAKAYCDFQETVYGILEIQKRYGVVNITMKNMNFQTLINNITRNIALIEPELATLKIKIGDLSRHCRACSLDLIPRNFLNGQKDLLKELIETELQSIQTELIEEYTTIYADLEEATKVAKSGSYLDIHKEIHAKIDAAIKEQIEELETLEYDAAAIELDFKTFTNLLTSSEQILDNVQQNFNSINSLLTINHL